jgi:predicted glycosyltransferase
MKIVVDINHPAHVHYFKNFIGKMKEKGHEILITASEKDISYRLLDLYGFEYIKIGNYGKSTFRKMVNVPVLDIKMLQAVRKFRPDIFL